MASFDYSKLLWLVRVSLWDYCWSNRLIVLIISRCLILVIVIIRSKIWLLLVLPIVISLIIISIQLIILFSLIISIFVDHILLWNQEVFAILVLSLIDTFTINIVKPSDMPKDLLHLLVCFLLRRWSLVIEVTWIKHDTKLGVELYSDFFNGNVFERVYDIRINKS